MSRVASGRRATIAEVALRLGVSKSTVSRAFNRPQLLLPETVERVREASIELGYVPSRLARSLALGLTGAAALVVPDIANPFFPQLIRAAQGALDERGMACLLGDSDERAERERQLVAEFAPDVDGILLMSPRLAADRVRELAAHARLVLLNRDIEGLWRVLLDTAPAFNEALAELYRLGHRRFAYVGGPDLSWSNAERLQAIETFTKNRRVSLTTVAATPATFEGGIQAGEDVLRRRPTAVLCFDDVVAQGVSVAAARAGLGVPGDVSIVGCDGTVGAMVHPRLATIELPYERAGRAAVDILFPSYGAASGDESADGTERDEPLTPADRCLRLAGTFSRGASIAPPPS